MRDDPKRIRIGKALESSIPRHTPGHRTKFIIDAIAAGRLNAQYTSGGVRKPLNPAWMKYVASFGPLEPERDEDGTVVAWRPPLPVPENDTLWLDQPAAIRNGECQNMPVRAEKIEVDNAQLTGLIEQAQQEYREQYRCRWPGRKKTGPQTSRLGPDDRALYPEMERLVAGGLHPYSAALQLARQDKVEGGPHIPPASRAKRLSDRWIKHTGWTKTARN